MGNQNLNKNRNKNRNKNHKKLGGGFIDQSEVGNNQIDGILKKYQDMKQNNKIEYNNLDVNEKGMADLANTIDLNYNANDPNFFSKFLYTDEQKEIINYRFRNFCIDQIKCAVKTNKGKDHKHNYDLLYGNRYWEKLCKTLLEYIQKFDKRAYAEELINSAKNEPGASRIPWDLYDWGKIMDPNSQYFYQNNDDLKKQICDDISNYLINAPQTEYIHSNKLSDPRLEYKNMTKNKKYVKKRGRNKTRKK